MWGITKSIFFFFFKISYWSYDGCGDGGRWSGGGADLVLSLFIS